MALCGGGFNWSARHTNHCLSKSSLVYEIPDTDLLHEYPEGKIVGALEGGLDPSPLACAYLHVPGRPRRFDLLVHPLVASVAESRVLLTAQQCAGDIDVIHVGYRAHHHM